MNCRRTKTLWVILISAYSSSTLSIPCPKGFRRSSSTQRARRRNTASLQDKKRKFQSLLGFVFVKILSQCKNVFFASTVPVQCTSKIEWDPFRYFKLIPHRRFCCFGTKSTFLLYTCIILYRLHHHCVCGIHRRHRPQHCWWHSYRSFILLVRNGRHRDVYRCFMPHNTSRIRCVNLRHPSGHLHAKV